MTDASALQLALARCADEPIHSPGSIQPHGALLVLSADAATVLQASVNAGTLLGAPLTAGAALAALPGIDPLLQPALLAWLASPELPFSRAVTCHGRPLHATCQAGVQGLLLELQPASAAEPDSLQALALPVRRFMASVEAEDGVAAVCQAAARELRQLTGFDRVLVYRFNEDWHGSVLAEDGNGTLPSYLDLRFPASDIPAQARALYLHHRVRLIADADYTPVPVLPAASPLDGQALDLSAVALRSVAPVHLEYMRNMGTLASMSVSIVVDGRLWGLVACHHALPRRLGASQLAACDFLGQMLALQIGARERSADVALRLRAKDVEVALLSGVARADTLHAGLVQNAEAWLDLLGANGAAVLVDDVVRTAGRTPGAAQLQALVAWLREQPAPQGSASAVFATSTLPALYPPAAAFADVGCGLVAVSISALHAHYVLWFRPELIHTVRWAGEPGKVSTPDGRLRPRASFNSWGEQVRGQAPRWSAANVDSAVSFRNGVIDFVLKRAEERAALSEQLQSSNKELEAFSYSISHDLRAPFRHIVGYAQLLRELESGMQDRSRHYLDSIIDGAQSAGRLVDDLLHFSQLGRSALDVRLVDMQKLVAELQQSVAPDTHGRQVEWHIGRLPPAAGDASLLRQALANLIDNALKYTRGRDPAHIHIDGEQTADEAVYTVRDNGVGFDMAYVDKLFGVFQRLHRSEDFEGSGIGLALARRIIERHGGWITADGRLDAGATFRMGLPRGRAGTPDPSHDATPDDA